MKLPNTAHTSRPWRIHELTRDFRLEDVWALPTPGGPGDFGRLVQMIASDDPSGGSNAQGAHGHRYHAQLAVYVKPNGLFGQGYMAAITPFRYLIVYPSMIKQIGRAWREHGDDPALARA